MNSKSLRNRYIGYWINGVREGYEVFFYSNDTKYEGCWNNNEKKGFGVFRFKNGTEYIGDFLQDRMINYLTEGFVKLNQGDGNYFDYDDSLEPKNRRLNFNNNNNGATSSNSTIERKNSKSSMLPPINNSKNGAESESMINNSKLEVIMENENSKGGEEQNEVNFKSKKYLIPKNAKNLKKEEKILSHLKTDKTEVNNISPKDLYNELEKKKKNKGVTEIRVMKDQLYLASNRMINEIGNNQFLSIIDLSDIFEFEIQYEQTQTEVSNSILRNISEFTKVYNKLLKLGSSEEESNAIYNKLGSVQIGDA